MECCNNKKTLKGGKTQKMNTRMMLWIIVGGLFIVALFLTFKIGVASAEQVQAVASTTKSAASSYGGMVGGC